MTSYKVERVTEKGEVIVSVTIDGITQEGSSFIDPVEDVNDSDKLNAFIEKLCAETEIVLEKVLEARKDIKLMVVDPIKVQELKGKM